MAASISPYSSSGADMMFLFCLRKKQKIRENAVIKIDGYHEIDSEMDSAFSALYAGFLTDPIADIDTLVARYFPAFEEAATAYYTRHPITNPVQEHFINNLTPIWNTLRSINRLGPAQRFWEHVLSLIRNLESHFQTRIHKGSIYYYWGGTAILNGEIEKGYSLMHSALIEDTETNKSPQPNTPAYRFVFLDYNDSRQHFLDLLSAQGRILESFLPHYAKLSASNLDGANFRNNFLAAHPRPEAILLLAYTVARLEKQLQNPPSAPDHAFAGILDFNMLFDLVLVIDSSIQAKSKVGWQFFDLARHLSEQAGLDLSQLRLEHINSERKRPGNFANVVIALLNGSFPMPDGGQLSPLATDIAIAFCIRNHAAHNIVAQSLVPTYTRQLMQSLFNTLFLTADTFYKNASQHSVH